MWKTARPFCWTSPPVTIEETGEVLQAEALGDKAMEILSSGGIKPMMRAKYGKD